MISMVEKEFMIAGLRKQRDSLNELMARLKTKQELDPEARLLYDRVTKEVEQSLKELKKFRKDRLEC